MVLMDINGSMVVEFVGGNLNIFLKTSLEKSVFGADKEFRQKYI